MVLDPVREHVAWGTICELSGGLFSIVDFKKLCFMAYEELSGNGKAETNVPDNKDKEIQGFDEVKFTNKEIDLRVLGHKAGEIYKAVLALGLNGVADIIEYLTYSDMFGRESSEFGTMEEMCKVVTSLIPDNACSVVDLCSGIGNFLIESALLGKKCTGYEFNADAVIESKIRAKINKAVYDINAANVLSTKIGQKYDFVFSDFPWGMAYRDEYVSEDDSLLNFEVNKKRIEWLFVKKAIDIMNDSGKAVVVVPNSLLMATSDKSIRKDLVEKGLVEKIILMPANTLKNTAIAYSLLVFSHKNKSIEIVDAREMSKEQFKRKKIDVESIIKTIKNNRQLVTPEEVAQKDYNFFYLFSNNEKLPEIKNPILLSDVAEIIGGYQYTSKSVTELEPGKGNIGIIRIADFADGKIDFENALSADLNEDKVAKYVLKENDIVLATKGTKINIAYVHNIGKRKYIPNSNLTIIRVFSEEQVNPLYLFLFLASETGKSYLSSIQTGSIIINISKTSLMKLSVPRLDKDSQEAMANRYLILGKELEEMKKKLDILRNKMDSIYEMEADE